MSNLTRRRLLRWGGAALLADLAGCATNPVFDTTLADAASAAAVPVSPPPFASSRPALPPLFEDIERRTFDFFWSTGNPANGMVPDRHPTSSPASIAAIGFALTAYVIGVDRGYITRDQARARTLATVRFFRNAPQGPQARGMSGHKGFFYHFLDMRTGVRSGRSELSTVDTALLVGGLLHAQAYFDTAHPDELEIRNGVDAIYWRIDWKWAQVRGQFISMGWSPEKTFIPHDWQGYNEAMLVVLLALGSPTHPVEDSAWSAWSESYRGAWGRFMGYEHLSFAPLFGHQYSHVWVDFRGIRDDYMRRRDLDYFENSRRATLAQHAYAIANPLRWKAYGEEIWGLTACDGPADATHSYLGESRQFHTYTARGPGQRDDGTLAPTAALGSIAFAPEICAPAAQAMKRDYGAHILGRHGFIDAFNPSFDFDDLPPKYGRRIPGVGWIAPQYLGIDQGPIVAMLENWRSGLIWRVMRTNPHIVRGLRRAGFTGGWLDSA